MSFFKNLLKGIAFDLDDTLFSRGQVVKAWLQRWSGAEEGSEELSRLVKLDGGGYADRASFFKKLAEMNICGRSGRFLREIFAEELPGMISVQSRSLSVIEALEERRYQLGILSNGGSTLQRAKLAAAGLGGFADQWPVIVSGETEFDKPDAGIFALMAESMGLPSHEILYVGDHLENDVMGSLEAGFHSAWMRNGRSIPPDLPEDVLVIDELEELLAHLG